MAKNTMGKKTTVEKPYQIWKSNNGEWTWLILKSYWADNTKPFAIAFCAVSSPFTWGDYDLGDVYWSEIFANATLIEDNTGGTS